MIVDVGEGVSQVLPVLVVLGAMAVAGDLFSGDAKTARALILAQREARSRSGASSVSLVTNPR